MKQIDVLIIEDSKYSADLNVRELKRAGFIVDYQVAASDGAMQKALRDKPWNIILSDNNMPGFGVLQALRIRNKSAPGVPFVIVSEDIPNEVIKQVMNEGCCAYLQKENLNELGQLIKGILESTHIGD